MIEFYFERLLLLLGFVFLFQTGQAKKYDCEITSEDVDSLVVKSDFVRHPFTMKGEYKTLIFKGLEE